MAQKKDETHSLFTSLSSANLASQEERDEYRAGYGGTALALVRGKGTPQNPHRAPTNSIATAPHTYQNTAALYAAWHCGEKEALRHWAHISERAAGHESERAAGHESERDTFMAAVWMAEKRERDTIANTLPPPADKENTGPQVSGTEPVTSSDELELQRENVLAYITTARNKLEVALGALATELAEYQTTGYQRLSVEAQSAKLKAFKEREAEINSALRWLSIGKTDIEKGFMCVDRAMHCRM